jgi:hypothetical protein
MSCLVCYRNRWRNGTIKAVSSEDPQCSAEYTQDDSPQLFWRSEDVDETVTIDCDLGAEYEYNFIALLGHNLTSNPATVIKVVGAHDSGFTTPDEDTLTHHANWLYEILGTARTNRYVRISILNATNPSGYLQVGTIVVGKGEYFNRMPSVPYQAGQKNETEIESSPSGNIFTVQERPSAFVINLLFVGLDQTSGVMVETLIKENASFLGFVLCLDSGNPNSKSDWLVLTEQTLLTCEKVNYWTWQLNAVEVL